MNLFYTLTGLLAGLLCGLVQAQTPAAVLTGRVLDAKTQQPVPFATVYLNNSTRGTNADENGTYRLANVPTGSLELIGSALGYKAFRQPLRITDNRPRTVDLRLEPADNALTGVTVTARHNQAWVRQFRIVSRELLGNRPMARQCQITNGNSLSFIEEKGHLRAQATEPLVIDNKALGYRLLYDLLYFDYYQGQMRFAGASHFTELTPTDARQQAQWQANRLKAYKGSLHHLLASLLAGTHEQEGYEVYRTPLALDPGTTTLPLVRATERKRIGARQADSLFRPGELAFERRLVSSQPLEVYYNRVYARNSPYRDSPYAYSMLLLPKQAFDLTTAGWITQGNGLDVRGYLGDDRLATLLPADWTPADKETIAATAITAGRPLRPDAWLDSLRAQQKRPSGRAAPLIFVQTDKWLYATGDQVWFSAYALDPARNLPVVAKNGLSMQVDLVAPGGQLVQHQWLRLTDGRAAGAFRLADTLASGTYRLRAYPATDTTGGKTAFFSSFPVFNGQRPGLSPPAPRSPAAAATLPDADIQFLPEGGHWLAGVAGKLGIRAMQANGKGRAVGGHIVDGAGNEVVRFSTNSLGIGHVVLTPQAGQPYTARIDQPAGWVTKPVALPAPEASGWSLVTDALSDSSHLLVTARVTGRDQEQPVYITLHQRNQLIYQQKWQLPKGEARFALPTAALLPGLCRLTLLDYTGKPRAERLVFVPVCEPAVGMRLILADKPRYASRETVAISFQLRDADNYPVSAVWSAAVTDADQLPDDTARADLRTYLLLTDELRGTVESPADYLGADKVGAVDDLLLTQGGRRLPAVLPADSAGGWFINGRVRDRRGRPMGSTPVLLSLAQGDQTLVRSLLTDAAGTFRLGGLTIADTIRVRARVLGVGEAGAVVTLDAPGMANPLLPAPAPDWASLTRFLGEARSRQAAAPAFYRDSTARLLAEVVVRAVKQPNTERPLDVQRASLHGEADKTLVVTREIASSCQNMGELISRVSGITQLTARRQSSFGDNSPLYMIDGNYVLVEVVNTLNPMEVSRIELLMNAGAAIYGARAANGIIAIYTRKGGDPELVKPTTPATILMGFETPRDFYVPRYELPDAASRVDKRDVLYWQPLGQTGTDGLATLTFPLSDTARHLRLVVQGLTNEGVPLSFTWIIPVR